MNLYQQSQVPIKTALCSLVQEAGSVQYSQGGTRTVFCNSLNDNSLRHSENFGGTECVTLLDNPTFPPDDRQSLQTIISLWPGLSAEMKIGILHMIESTSKVHVGRR